MPPSHELNMACPVCNTRPMNEDECVVSCGNSSCEFDLRCEFRMEGDTLLDDVIVNHKNDCTFS